ncbi:unnamed protein product [Auanema sp. JU1783]|nr:unnamed protein product [Auanema sp. JU1783]
MVGMTFKTKKPFTGRIYVQGLSDDATCSQAFVDNRNLSRMSMVVKNGDCTMQRHRVTGKLEGLMYSLTMIVSFHGTFVTRADRAYKCICFFRSQKTVSNSIQIGPIGPTELLNTGVMPTCSYSIRSGSPDGPPVAYGEVGERIYHIWQCDMMDKGFLVHSCKVTDGRGFEFDLLDIDGCAIDPVIQPDIVYDEDKNMAIAETYGYKFSDTNNLNYECVLEICSRTNGECNGLTPPMCDGSDDSDSSGILLRRRRRAVREVLPRGGSIDVVASISMIDSMNESQVIEEMAVVNETTTLVTFKPFMESLQYLWNEETVCLSPLSLSILAAGMTIFSIVCIIIVLHLSRIHTYVLNTQNLSKSMMKIPQQP